MYKIEIKKSLKNFHTFIKLRIEKYKGYTYSNTVKNTQLGIIVILDNTVEYDKLKARKYKIIQKCKHKHTFLKISKKMAISREVVKLPIVCVNRGDTATAAVFAFFL